MIYASSDHSSSSDLPSPLLNVFALCATTRLLLALPLLNPSHGQSQSDDLPSSTNPFMILRSHPLHPSPKMLSVFFHQTSNRLNHLLHPCLPPTPVFEPMTLTVGSPSLPFAPVLLPPATATPRVPPRHLPTKWKFTYLRHSRTSNLTTLGTIWWHPARSLLRGKENPHLTPPRPGYHI